MKKVPGPIIRRQRPLYLHRRLFWWFGMSIFITLGLSFGAAHLLGRFAPAPWQDEATRVSRFVGQRFAEVWDKPTERAELASSAANELELDLRLLDKEGTLLESFGQHGSCKRPTYSLPIERGGVTLGRVEVCASRRYVGGLWRLFVPLLCAALVLWAASGRIARRLTRPLADLARVARDIGDGKLQSRVRLRPREAGELGQLAESINDMAGKIERQMAEQRELLAGVSHELRTPLTRMRVLIELSKDHPEKMVELDREIDEIDALVGDLLASARLDFSALRRRSLEARAVAARALDRGGEDAERLVGEDAKFEGDASLMARALANLLDNANKHGGGVRALRIKTRAGRVAFEVEDNGAGFSEEAARRLFQPFNGSDSETSSLGLGLALVRRIAEAHGGTAYAENIEGGARVGFEVSSA